MTNDNQSWPNLCYIRSCKVMWSTRNAHDQPESLSTRTGPNVVNLIRRNWDQEYISPGKFPIGMHGPRVRRAWLWALWPWWQALKMAYRTCAFAAIHDRQMALSSLFSLSTFPLWLSCFSDGHGLRSSCDGGSERHSFRERQPAKSLQLGKKQAVLEHAEWTYRYTTYRWWVQRAIFRASVGGRQHSDNHGKFSLLGTLWWLSRHWAHRNELQGIWGFNQTNSSENEACCHSQNCLNADKTLRLLPSFEKAVLRRRMCKFYTADFQNSTAKRKKNSLAKRSPLP